MSINDREPICGFCWANIGVRQPLEYSIKHGWWECPTCCSKTIHPCEDEEELREATDDPYRWEKTISSMLRSSSGGGSSGRRRKKKPKKRPEWPGTLV